MGRLFSGGHLLSSHRRPPLAAKEDPLLPVQPAEAADKVACEVAESVTGGQSGQFTFRHLGPSPYFGSLQYSVYLHVCVNGLCCVHQLPLLRELQLQVWIVQEEQSHQAGGHHRHTKSNLEKKKVILEK